MYTLYGRPGSGSFVVEAALLRAGAPFSKVTVPRRDQSPDYAAISPLGQVPALGLPEGGTMTESAAMCLLIAERFPQAQLAPSAGSPERAAFLRWMFFLSSMLYPTLMRYFFCGRVTAEESGLEAVKAAAVVQADREFAVVDAALAATRHLAGEKPTIADVYLLMLAHWHPVDARPRPEWKNIVRVCEELKADPMLAGLNEAHRFWA